MTRSNRPDDPEIDIDALLSEANSQAKDLPDALFANIIADAEAVQPNVELVQSAPAGLWQTLGAAIGGWPAFGSLATAAIAGLYFGVSDPTLASNPFASEIETEFSDFLSDGSGIFEEEIAQ